MIDINECKNKAKLLAEQSKKILGHQKLNDFSEDFNKCIKEYDNKYMFSSNSIDLQSIEFCYEWISSILDDKTLLTPIIVDKMVNDEDLCSLSLYQNLYAGTDLIPNIDEDGFEFHKYGGGDNALALITGCHWIEQNGLG
jgi:hypothetical protein